MLFSDHKLTSEQLLFFGSVVAAIRLECDDADVSVWTFLRYVATHHPDILTVEVPDEMSGLVDEVARAVCWPKPESTGKEGGDMTETDRSRLMTDNQRIKALVSVAQQLKDRTNTVIEGVMAHLRDDNAKEILGPGLSPLIGRGSLKSIVTFAIYADVLRMMRDMVMADGEISEEEVQESLGLLSMLAAGFAKVRRKEYASFTQLTPDTARQFLSQYESDAGLFGHANEATKWAGVTACRNIEATCGDSGPLNSFGGALVSWADSVASADGMSTTEQQHLAVIRSLCTSGRDASPGSTQPHDAEVATRELNQGGSNESEDSVTEEKLLTREVAKRFVADPDSVELSEYTLIEDDAAEVLSLHQGELSLDSITHVSVEALTALSRHRGCVNLRGLAGISKDHARVLAGFLSGIELPIDDCDPEVQKILLTHPSFRIHDYSELTEWLLEKLEYDDDVDCGRPWVSEEVMGVLLDVCTCWQSADAANGLEMTGSDLNDILTSVKAAGTQEIHIVRLFDNDQSVFMFVGTVEDIKNRLLPIASCESKKNPVDDDDDDDEEG